MKFINTGFKNYITGYAGLSKTCWEQILCSFVHSISTGFCFYLSIYLINRLHFNTATIGLLIAAYGVGTTLGGITAGKLCDRFSCHVVLITSLLIKTVGITAFIFLKTPIDLMSALFIVGFSNYGFIVANNTYGLKLCHHNETLRLKVINLFYVASNLGLGLSVLMMTTFITHMHVLFAIAAILLLGLAIFYMTKPLASAIENITQTHSKNDVSHSKPARTYFCVFILTLTCIFLIG